jgi:hypothetical protein
VANIVTALNAVSDLEALADAFRLDHYRVRAEVQVEADPHNYTIDVQGRFFDKKDGKEVGKFRRKIELVGKRFRVYHAVIEIDDDHADDGVAWEHYKRALRYYYAILKADKVYMDAEYDGPYTWVDFGFEFTDRDWQTMLADLERIHLSHYGEPFRHSLPVAGTAMKHLRGDDGYKIGRDAIRSVQARRGGSLRMELDFADKDTLVFLRKEGLLDEN